jgi:hypothetical protein
MMPRKTRIPCALLTTFFVLPLVGGAAAAEPAARADRTSIAVPAVAAGAAASGPEAPEPGAMESEVVADSAAIAALTRALVAGAATDSARAAALYEWVARNIAYDVDGYLAGRIGGETAEQVFQRRIAVCGGYVALFGRMAAEAGLRVEPVTGYAKGFDHRAGRPTRRDNHAWLAVRIDGRWRLLDPTWGAGSVRDGRFEPAFDWYYFLVSPDELILSHYPRQRRWQMTARAMDRKDFERLPVVPRSLFSVGFEAGAVRSNALAAGVRDFPAVATDTGLRVVAAPVAGTLRSGETVSIELVWNGADVALVSGGVWTHLSRSGDRFHGQAPAGAGALWVVGQDASGPQYRTLLHYRVD